MNDILIYTLVKYDLDQILVQVVVLWWTVYICFQTIVTTYTYTQPSG